MDRDKRQVQLQWDTDPCGAHAVADEPGSLDFYRGARRQRYEVEGPWFDRVVRFEEWAGREVLEIGVGLGSDHFRFAQAGGRMTALDLSREHLRQTRRHLDLEGYRTRPVYGDAESLPFPDASFDLVYSFGVLHHTPGTEAAIREVHRILRPGGTALIGLYHRDSAFFWVNTVLVQGIRCGKFARLGWRGTLSEIEHRSSGSSAVPLVKVYSRRGVRRLMAPFSEVSLTTCHVESSHFWVLDRRLRRVSRDDLERRLGWAGWYVMARATKAPARSTDPGAPAPGWG
jgi:SAM-dependent methyltransferase